MSVPQSVMDIERTDRDPESLWNSEKVWSINELRKIFSFDSGKARILSPEYAKEDPEHFALHGKGMTADYAVHKVSLFLEERFEAAESRGRQEAAASISAVAMELRR